MTRTYVITGATSFLGRKLVQRLLAGGNTIYAICRNHGKAVQMLGDNRNLIILECELSRYEQLAEKIVSADVFIHLAWDGTDHGGRNMADVQRQNVLHCQEALRQAISIGCQLFVEAGSQAEYGILQAMITEESPCKPFSEYGKAKLEVCRNGFDTAEKGSIKYLHLRIFSLYGEDDHPWTLVMSCVQKMLHNEPIDLSACTQNWNFLYVDDAARQIEGLIDNAVSNPNYRHEIYNIASNDTRVLKDFVLSMKNVCHSSSLLKFGEVVPEHLISLNPNVSKTANVVGTIDTVKFENVIHRILVKYKNNDKGI